MDARAGTTERLSKAEKAIVDKYLGLLDAVPGPVSVWLTTDAGLLHLHTLIPPDDSTERKLYEIESSLMRAIDPALVDFDVYVRPETIRYLFKDTPPLLQRD